MKQWVCQTCRYEQTSYAQPSACPVCGAQAAEFEESDEGVTEPEIRRPIGLMMPSEYSLWRCQVCSAQHQGQRPPNVCSECGVGPEMWVLVSDSVRPRMDTDPAEQANDGTCSICSSAVNSMLVKNCPVCGGRLVWLRPAPNSLGSQRPHHRDSAARTYVVLGSGVAALRAAEVIRTNDVSAQVIMITRESCLPYHRLNLTRYLDGGVDAASLMMRPPTWYAEQGIDVRLETDVVSIHPREHLVRTRKREIEYDRLVIATGARVDVPNVPNVWLHGVHPLRSLRDCARILESSGVGRRVIVLGGGILGIEAAAAMRRRGCEVTVCEHGEHLMRNQLDRAAARLLQSHLEGQGVRFVIGRELEAIDGDEYVQGVRLGGEAYEPADLVLLATGIKPNTSPARSAGLRTVRGVVVDDTLQTSDPDIYAAGDVVEHRGRTFGLWPVAMEMGAIAGANAAGGAESFFPTTHSNLLKVVDIELCAIGRVVAHGATERELAHTEEGGVIYQKVLLDGNRIVGGILLGDTQATGAIQQAIVQGKDVSHLVESCATLRDLLKQLQR